MLHEYKGATIEPYLCIMVFRGQLQPHLMYEGFFVVHWKPICGLGLTISSRWGCCLFDTYEQQCSVQTAMWWIFKYGIFFWMSHVRIMHNCWRVLKKKIILDVKGLSGTLCLRIYIFITIKTSSIRISKWNVLIQILNNTIDVV